MTKDPRALTFEQFVGLLAFSVASTAMIGAAMVETKKKEPK